MNEVELLLSCARSHGIREELKCQIDWPLFIRMADGHGLIPLVWERLCQTCSQQVPPWVVAELSRGYRATAAQSALLTRELARILELLESRKISALPLKGPALAWRLYGNPACRVFGDLDLLIRRGQVSQAKEALVARGYCVRSRLNRAEEDLWFHSQSEVSLRREDALVCLDLHWEILPQYFPCSMDSDGLWQRLEFQPFLDRKVLSLTDEDLLLFLCAHGAKHVWERLGWLVDVARLLQSEAGLDWTRIRRRALTTGGERMLLLGVSLAHDLLEAPVPAATLTEFAAAAWLPPAAARARQRLFSLATAPSTTLSVAFNWKLTARRWARVKHGLASLLVPTEADWTTLRLPRRLFPLYYPFRAFRLALKYGSRRLGSSPPPI